MIRLRILLPLLTALISLTPMSAMALDTQWKFTGKTFVEFVSQGYRVIGATRYPPSESTSKTYETSYMLQKDASVINCFEEFAIDAPGPNSRLVSSRFACLELVKPEPYKQPAGPAATLPIYTNPK